jgi:hypothetical protein
LFRQDSSEDTSSRSLGSGLPADRRSYGTGTQPTSPLHTTAKLLLI